MNEEIRVLKIGSCESLSGRSSLTYQIGSKGEEVYIRLVENSSRGLFSKEWLPIKEIKISADVPFAASSLRDLFKGKSINTPGFMVAVLRAETLIKNTEDKSRTYMGCDPMPFHSAMEELMKAEVSLADNHRPLPSAKTAKKANRRP